MMCKKLMPVYSENHTEYVNKCPVDEMQTYFNVTAGGTYINQGAFKVFKLYLYSVQCIMWCNTA
jgi:hypothetical protein